MASKRRKCDEEAIPVASDYSPKDWTLDSWKGKPIKQQPEYDDMKVVEEKLSMLRELPPIVHTGEIDQLKEHLAEAARGERFVLQGGDCAELFNYCNQTHIENKVKILLQMSLIIIYGARIPIVRIGRMAGQYGKPRSSNTEVVNGETLPTFRGENVNGIEANDRKPDPERLMKCYFHSATTLNYVRALMAGGFADLRHPDAWDLGHVQNFKTRMKFESAAASVLDSLHFMETLKSERHSALRSVDFYSSHEGLLLNYEEALTRQKSESSNSRHYNLGTHFLWIGDRTRALDSAHVEYFRGIANPIGVKVGPTMKNDELVQLLKVLDPDNEPGRITLITRYGASKIHDFLPGHIKAVMEAGYQVVWICDPMHGNTELTSNKTKTRNFDNVLEELRSAFSIHKQCGRALNGVHFELTGDDVTECLGGTTNLSENDLGRNYATYCDPRLNYGQSLDMAFLIAEYYQGQRSSAPASI